MQIYRFLALEPSIFGNLISFFFLLVFPIHQEGKNFSWLCSPFQKRAKMGVAQDKTYFSIHNDKCLSPLMKFLKNSDTFKTLGIIYSIS